MFTVVGLQCHHCHQRWVTQGQRQFSPRRQRFISEDHQVDHVRHEDADHDVDQVLYLHFQDVELRIVHLVCTLEDWTVAHHEEY